MRLILNVERVVLIEGHRGSNVTTWNCRSISGKNDLLSCYPPFIIDTPVVSGLNIRP